MNRPKYIFVDFDGVLHGNTINKDIFCHSKMFCARLYEYRDNFRIVISSSWREEYDFDVLMHAFDEDKSLMDNVVGVTPILEKSFSEGARYLEIKSYCREHGISDDEWIAIDDMSDLFPSNCPNLILTNGDTGLTSQVMDKIEKFINGHYPKLTHRMTL